jgi:hypothetical protein
VAIFVNFLILLTMCLYVTNLTFWDGSSASLIIPRSVIQATAAGEAGRDENLSPIITLKEAEDLINLLPVTLELRTKGIEVKWDRQSVPTMNNIDYYFFWIYNVTAQRARDIGSISVGNYAVNRRTADVRVWHVSDEVSFGDDGSLVTSNGIEQLQEELRKKHGIDSKLIQEFRPAHLAKRIIPREEAQTAIRLPITERSTNTTGLSCWKGSEPLLSKLGRSPIISSILGYRAYAEVEATAFKPKHQETYGGPLCENSIKLFLGKDDGSSFQTILDTSVPKNDCITVESQESCQIKGIRLVDWSKDGRYLLADAVLWIYESDALSMKVPIIYDTTKSVWIRPDVYNFFDAYYRTNASKADCEFERLTEGFSPDGNLIISASRSPTNPTYDQVFCIDKKQTFLFELGTNMITRLAPIYKAQRYRVGNSISTPKPKL